MVQDYRPSTYKRVGFMGPCPTDLPFLSPVLGLFRSPTGLCPVFVPKPQVPVRTHLPLPSHPEIRFVGS